MINVRHTGYSGRMTRLTTKWTPTLKEAFGETGTKGTNGELQAVDILKAFGFTVEYFPDDRTIQTSGVDLLIDGIPCDVKANLHTGGDVCFDSKILTGEAVFVMHINLSDPDDYIVYKVDSIRPLIAGKQANSNGCYWFKRDEVDTLC